MSPALEKRDVKQRLAVSTSRRIEGARSAYLRTGAGVRVAKLVYLEVALVFPAVDEEAVDVRCCTASQPRSRPYSSRGPRPALLARKVRLGMANANEDPRPVHAGSRSGLPLAVRRDRPGPLGPRDLPRRTVLRIRVSAL